MRLLEQKFLYRLINNIKLNYFSYTIFISLLISYSLFCFLMPSYSVIRILLTTMISLYFYYIKSELESIIVDYVCDEKSQVLLIYLFRILLLNLFVFLILN